MTNLIQKLQDAETGSRKLDLEISIEFKLFDPTDSAWTKTGVYTWHKNYRFRHSSIFSGAIWDDCFQPDDFSTSIDAALTLVPDGWYLGRLANDGLMKGAFNLKKSCSAMLLKNNRRIIVHGHALPVVVCLAALRARQENQE